MNYKLSINRLTIAVICLVLCTALSSCRYKKAYIIAYKSLLTENPYLSRYCYTTNGFDNNEIIDSTSRYEIGDDVRKYYLKK